MNQQTYTQVMGENGEIKYVPTSPPPAPTPDPNSGLNTGASEETLKEIKQMVDKASLKGDDKLTDVLMSLVENNKKLRYNKRLQSGKLDGRRLTAYRTSDKLFKLKAIKDKKYQFTFLIDTSGSMLGTLNETDHEDNPTRIQMSLEAVARTVKTLQAMDIKSSVFGMNNSFRLFKRFDEELDDDKLLHDTFKALAEDYDDEGNTVNCAGGTSEWVAYEQATKYISEHSDPKVTNVVIILSDGEPGGSGGTTQVILEGEPEYVLHEGDKDHSGTLARFWEKRPEFMAFGLGIGRKAKQVPTNRQIDDITKLPEVMGNLLTELML